jgi:hypothetical protein
MVKVQIDTERNNDHWKVKWCSVNIDNDTIHPMLSGEEYKSKDAAIAELKQRARKWLAANGRTETDDQIEWRIT